ncbi:MAG: 30S ribosomal protein S12 methylthiotransferase RimO [Bacteroidales bacterium]|nr:30S ribosomal protein S12 methylthiotransferase RimO [Bacteroidales bacterium]
MPSLRISVLGCSKNTVDSEHLLAVLAPHYEIVQDGRAVDCLLIDTCGFIGDAKEQSVQAVLEAARLKEDGMVGKLIVFGCLSQRYGTELPGLIQEVDAWFGARDFKPLLEYLEIPSAEIEMTGRRLLSDGCRGTAYLKISEGCDRRCSYCAIPLIRGPHRSVPVGTLVREAEGLAAQGVRELVIIAQDTTYYGMDLYGKRCLAGLLEKLSEVEGIEWIRLHYSYPADFPEDVLELMAGNPKICKYVDIPLQHVSDRVLKAMRRHIDGEGTRRIIEKIRNAVPGVALRTTMIVGHPGEGEEEFAELLRFVKETGFERLGAFAYSEEEGTYGAEHFPDTVPSEVKNARLDALMELQRGISLKWNLSRIGSQVRVLAESHSDGMLVCRSEFESPEVDGEILVKCPSGLDAEKMCGTFFDVTVTGADEYDLQAVLM